MQCVQCGLEPTAEAMFCSNCGSQFQLRCEICDTPNPIDSNFCYSCGTRLGSGQGLGTHPVALAVECPRCHAANEPSSVYCFSCGLPLEGKAVASRSSSIGKPAGFWIWLGASLIDGVILSIVGIVVIIIAAIIVFALVQGAAAADYEVSGFYILGFYLLWLLPNGLYYTLVVGIWGTTLGKRALGLYVIRMDDSKVGIGRAFARYMSYFISVLTIGIGFLMIAFRRDKRGLHDLICDTQVVKRHSNTRPYA